MFKANSKPDWWPLLAWDSKQLDKRVNAETVYNKLKSMAAD